jgi:hypothetical protein
MTVKTAKIFGLVALTALSLGSGTVMAQSEGSDDPGVPYWTLARQADALRQMEARNAEHVQAGSPDADALRSGTNQAFRLTPTTPQSQNLTKP